VLETPGCRNAGWSLGGRATFYKVAGNQSQQHFPQHGLPSHPQVQDGQSQQHASVQQVSVRVA
jgi:hypothetical protein